MRGVKGGGVRPSHIEAVHPHRRVSSRPNCNTPFKKEKKRKIPSELGISDWVFFKDQSIGNIRQKSSSSDFHIVV